MFLLGLVRLRRFAVWLFGVLACGDPKTGEIKHEQVRQDQLRQLPERNTSIQHGESASRNQVVASARIYLSEDKVPPCSQAELNKILYVISQKSFSYCGEENKWIPMRQWLEDGDLNTDDFSELMKNCESGQQLVFENKSKAWVDPAPA